jgi:hypothetical protein
MRTVRNLTGSVRVNFVVRVEVRVNIMVRVNFLVRLRARVRVREWLELGFGGCSRVFGVEKTSYQQFSSWLQP